MNIVHSPISLISIPANYQSLSNVGRLLAGRPVGLCHTILILIAPTPFQPTKHSNLIVLYYRKVYFIVRDMKLLRVQESFLFNQIPFPFCVEVIPISLLIISSLLPFWNVIWDSKVLIQIKVGLILLAHIA